MHEGKWYKGGRLWEKKYDLLLGYVMGADFGQLFGDQSGAQRVLDYL